MAIQMRKLNGRDLAARDRRAWQLRTEAEMTVKAIAERLGVSYQAVADGIRREQARRDREQP